MVSERGGVPQIDFSPIGDLGKTYDTAKRDATRQRTLADLGTNPGPLDYGAASKALLAAGDTEGGLSLANLAQAALRDTRDFGFRQQESARAQTNADRTFDFQKQQADEAARGFETREIDDGNGGKMLVRIHKATGEVTKSPIAGAQDAPTNPYAYGKQNENQSKDSGFANRMFRAEGVLRDPAVEAAAVDVGQHMRAKAPGFVANFLTSPDYQRYDQAKRDFVNATLRRESGAAISQSEFDNANIQYFPQPGDSPERIAEKRKNRQDTLAGIAGGGGQSYKPPFTFGPNGELVPTGNAAQGATPAKPATPPGGGVTPDQIRAARTNPAGALAEAKAAIAAGVPPEAVAIRLRSVGINPALLTGGDRPGFASPGARE